MPRLAEAWNSSFRLLICLCQFLKVGKGIESLFIQYRNTVIPSYESLRGLLCNAGTIKVFVSFYRAWDANNQGNEGYEER